MSLIDKKTIELFVIMMARNQIILIFKVFLVKNRKKV